MSIKVSWNSQLGTWAAGAPSQWTLPWALAHASLQMHNHVVITYSAKVCWNIP